VAAIVSAFDGLQPYRVELCLVFVAVMTVANLRGLKESGALFAPPTYVYVGLLITLIVVGLYRVFIADDIGVIGALAPEGDELLGEEAVGALSLFWILKAFSSGAVALTGVEAVSNGVPAFRRPESPNAAKTLVAMAVILGTCFLGLSIVASHLQPVVEGSGQTVLSALAEQVYGGRNFLYYATQFATFAILILAANTAYADFPRISSIIARDGYWPRQFANRGDRLVFSNGIVLLALMASGLIVAFGGKVSALIPLYAVGVFTGFTLSQTGMVIHHFRIKEPRWQLHSVINGIGAFTTGLVAMVVVVTKFTDGAWIPAAVIPIMLLVLKAINRHYVRVRKAVHVEPGYRPARRTHLVVVLVASVNKGVVNAITYARSLAPDRLIAVSVVSEPHEEEDLHRQWAEYNLPIELHTLFSPYRELTRPVLSYLDELDRESGDDIITVVIPEFVTTWSTQFLHNQSALALKARLLYRPNTVVTSVPVVVDTPG
jgi:amino acid transporter